MRVRVGMRELQDCACDLATTVPAMPPEARVEDLRPLYTLLTRRVRARQKGGTGSGMAIAAQPWSSGGASWIHRCTGAAKESDTEFGWW